MSRIGSKTPATPSATTTSTRATGAALRRRSLLKLAAGGLAAGALAPRLSVSARAASPTTITVWTWGGVERFAPRIAAFKRLYPDVAARIEVKVVSPGKQDPEV